MEDDDLGGELLLQSVETTDRDSAKSASAAFAVTAASGDKRSTDAEVLKEGGTTAGSAVYLSENGSMTEQQDVQDGADDEDEDEDENFQIVVTDTRPTFKFGGGNKYVRTGASSAHSPNIGPVSSSQAGTAASSLLSTTNLQLPGGRKTAFDVDIDALEDKPWRKPGADLADYFNYGFNEQTWRIYCAKQLEHRRDVLLAQQQGSRKKTETAPSKETQGSKTNAAPASESASRTPNKSQSQGETPASSPSSSTTASLPIPGPPPPRGPLWGPGASLMGYPGAPRGPPGPPYAGPGQSGGRGRPGWGPGDMGGPRPPWMAGAGPAAMGMFDMAGGMAPWMGGPPPGAFPPGPWMEQQAGRGRGGQGRPPSKDDKDKAERERDHGERDGARRSRQESHRKRDDSRDRDGREHRDRERRRERDTSRDRHDRNRGSRDRDRERHSRDRSRERGGGRGESRGDRERGRDRDGRRDHDAPGKRSYREMRGDDDVSSRKRR